MRAVKGLEVLSRHLFKDCLQCGMKLGQKIHDRLREIGKQQSELAAFLGINQAAVSQWKTKTAPDRKRWREIARFCGWETVDEMLAGTDDSGQMAGPALPPPSDVHQVDPKLLQWTINQLMDRLPAMGKLSNEKRALVIAEAYAFVSNQHKMRPSQGVDLQSFNQLLRFLEATL